MDQTNDQQMTAPAATQSQTIGERSKALRREPGTMRRRIMLGLYLIALFLPIYWLVKMSFQSNEAITSGLSLIPQHLVFDHYAHIFSNPAWYMAFFNSLEYTLLNAAISVTVALPAAYAFNRYNFVGDKHIFFWLLTNLMLPPAIFAMPFFNQYSALGLFDTIWAVALAHCLFNVPLAVWILEGFVGGVPREIDETAAIDGYSFPVFFIKIFIPLIANGIGVTAFFCFMFSWIEQLLATTLTTTNAQPFVAVMQRAYTGAGENWGLLAAAGVLTMIPGAVVVWFVRNHIARGFALGRV
jgi:glycerol transport system permease protein